MQTSKRNSCSNFSKKTKGPIMKSVIIEDNSIAKAVEKGWAKAGNPMEFSVQIFEVPEKNFFGLTKSMAKVGIFFQEKNIVKSDRPSKKPMQQVERKQANRNRNEERQQPQTKQADRARQPQQKQQESRPTQTRTTTSQPKQSMRTIKKIEKPQARPQIQQQPQPQLQSRPQARPQIQKQPQPQLQSKPQAQQQPVAKKYWTPEMVNIAQQWIQKALGEIKKGHIKAELSVNNKRLFIKLSEKVYENHSDEQQLFRSFGALIMQTLRTTYKKELYGLDIIITKK